MGNNETIDMNSLTQKELLILLNVKVETMGKSLEKVTDEHTSLLVRVSNIETRSKIYSSIIAVASSMITSMIITYLNK